MNWLTKTLQSSTGEMSSKRVAFLFSQPFIVFCTIFMLNRLLKDGQYDFAVTVYNTFAIYCLVLGGFVTSELLLKLNPFNKK